MASTDNIADAFREQINRLNRTQQTVVIIDEAHQLDRSFIEALKDELSKGKLKFLMATTYQDYKVSGLQEIMQSDALKRRVEIFPLDEISFKDSFAIIHKKNKNGKNPALSEEDLKKVFLISLFINSDATTSPNRGLQLLARVQTARKIGKLL